ncbi:MAG: HAD family hydrolase [Bacteroidota bacterium]
MPSLPGPAAVLFDMGGTLEDVRVDHGVYVAGAKMIGERLERAGITVSPPEPGELAAQIESGLARYKRWAMSVGCIECSPLQLWSEWLLDEDGFRTAVLTDDLAEELSFLWETRCFRRCLRPDARAVLRELASCGYRLGIISNSIARTQVQRTLRLYGLEHCFSTVQVSSLAGKRKPDPLMFVRAAADLGLPPEQCMYIGDSYTRDVVGARAARYGYVLWISSCLGERTDAEQGPIPAFGDSGQQSTCETWEQRICTLTEILTILGEAPWTRTGGRSVGNTTV